MAVGLVMTDRTLFGGGAEPAQLHGFGTVAPDWARELVAEADTTRAGVWLQRLLTNSADHLVAMESRSRHAPPGLARFITYRDGATCRSPWCDAPVRHVDHVVDSAAGGPTSAENQQGRCERCNYLKQAAGWASVPVSRPPPSRGDPPPGSHSAEAGPPDIRTQTPTGHRYTSRAPHLPRTE